MEKHGADRTAAEGELFIGVAAAIIDIKFCGVPVGSGGILQHFLEVIGVIIIKKSPANQQTGMVINDHDAVYPPAAAVFCYVGNRYLPATSCQRHLPQKLSCLVRSGCTPI